MLIGENNKVHLHNKVVKKLNGVADILIPPRRIETPLTPMDKIMKIVYGKTILSS